MTPEAWRYVSHKIDKRKREDKEEKETAVMLSGIRVPPPKVRKETSRPRNRLTITEQAQIAASKS